ncbi:MAG TPA: type II secretion system protein GspF, partial [Planctomycetota bacterium]|nr:type II secretion system protein GspF [Planctomycetota bacterium]
MTTFKYAAKKAGGQSVEGTIQAGDRNEALGELRKQNLVVLKVEAVADKGGEQAKKSGGGGLFSRGAKINKTELVLFTRQL